MASSVDNKFLSSKDVAVIACPFSGGQPKAGVDTGPLQLVESGLLDDLNELGWKVDFQGHDRFKVDSQEDDPDIGKLHRPRLVSKVTKELSDVVASHVKAGQLALTLGGDHSLGMGTVSGSFAAHPDACLIWVDAHADINTPETTPSGNMHGLPVSFLMGLPGTDIPEYSWLKPCLSPRRIVYIGLRDVDPGEKKILREHGIRAFSMHDVDRHGIGKVVEMALDAVNPDRTLPIHCSFDVDSLDPTVAPSTGTPVRGGLTFREGHYICEALAETGLLVALDIMEVNPSLQDQAAVQQTVSIGRSLTRSALGETLL